MTKTNNVFLAGVSLVASLALLLMAFPALAAPPAAADKGNWIVMLDDDASVLPEHAAEQAIERAGGRVSAVYESAIQGFAVRDASKRALERMPGVALVEPNVKVELFELPTGVDRIDSELNTIADIDGTDDVRVDVDVAIIDTGVDVDHPDLNVYRGVNCVGGCGLDTDPSVANDTNGHGTHVAGTVAALDNGSGVVGVAPGARLWAVKVFGDGYIEDIISGVDYVTENAAEIDVANMSLGGYFNETTILRTAIQKSTAEGVVYVVAAGNDRRDVYGSDGIFGGYDVFPAAYPEVATISALTDTDGKPGGQGPSYRNRSDLYQDDSFALFSNYGGSVVNGNPVQSPGASIDLILPGFQIHSTYASGGYATLSGTSMASPHAAGLAALEIATNGRANDAVGVYAIRQALIDQAYGQTSANGLADQNDPDSNPEPIGYAVVGEIPVAPTVTITTPTAGEVATGTIGIAANANDQDGAVVSVAFSANGVNLGSDADTDGTDGWGVSWDTTTVTDGTYTITAVATDDSGETGSDSIDIIVDNVNEAPTAVATADPDTVVLGNAVTFDGTGSSDPDGDTLSYNWAFGDGVTGNGEVVSHTYTATGTFSATLTVTDSDNEQATDVVTITVTDPVAGATESQVDTISYSGYGGPTNDKHLTTTFSVVNDLGEAIVGATIEATIINDSGESWMVSVVTDSSGVASYDLKNISRGTYTTTINQLTANGLTWDGVTPTNSFTTQ